MTYALTRLCDSQLIPGSKKPLLPLLFAMLIGIMSPTVVAEQSTLRAQELIESLGLEGHVEGGFYRRTYEATGQSRIASESGERFSMTSIFYLLTAEGPVGHCGSGCCGRGL